MFDIPLSGLALDFNGDIAESVDRSFEAADNIKPTGTGFNSVLGNNPDSLHVISQFDNGTDVPTENVIHKILGGAGGVNVNDFIKTATSLANSLWATYADNVRKATRRVLLADQEGYTDVQISIKESLQEFNQYYALFQEEVSKIAKNWLVEPTDKLLKSISDFYEFVTKLPSGK